MTHTLLRLLTFVLGAGLTSLPLAGAEALVRFADLDLGERQTVVLSDGRRVELRLLRIDEVRDVMRQAVRTVRVELEVDGAPISLMAGNYHLPQTVEPAGVQIDCPITRNYASNSNRPSIWGLQKAARFRLWPAGAPWMPPDSFLYPLRQRWFASATQMANEPTYVNGEEKPGTGAVYYHYGLDFGGAEGLVEVVAATDGRVVSASGRTLPDHRGSPALPRYDVIYILDDRGWYYRYSHLQTIEVTPGQQVRRGQRLGLLGKEGSSGGWSHLHFDITSRMPSGEWCIQDAYPYVWEAWIREKRPALIAVARPHHFVSTGESVTLDGRRSWSAAGQGLQYFWTFGDGQTARGAVVHRTYARPGSYSEILEVSDAAGHRAWDFCVVQVVDPSRPQELPPTIHAAYHPTTGIRTGDPVTFKVRSFRTEARGETWNFGDGSPEVAVRSDANASKHAVDGYATTTHRFSRPGHYRVKVQHTNARGEPALAHLLVTVE